MRARIVPVETEKGIRYMLVYNGRTLCEEEYWSVANMRAICDFNLDVEEYVPPLTRSGGPTWLPSGGL